MASDSRDTQTETEQDAAHPDLAPTLEVLDFVNARHGMAYTLVRRLAGGHQSGAYLLAGPDGDRTVLKWSMDLSWAEQVQRAAPMVAHARAGGWPTPPWLAVGATPAGQPYQVQGFADGTPAGRLDRAVIVAVLAIVDMQAGLAPATDRDWSDHDHRVVFLGESGFADTVGRFSATTASLVDRLRAWTSDWEHTRWPPTDLVHGDLNADNILLTGGRVSAFVDVEAIGAGSRVHDLATLLMYAFLHGGAFNDVLDHARQVAHPGQLEVALTSCLLGLLAFGVDHWPHDLDKTAQQMSRLVGVVSSSRNP